jgi:Transposase DDE domain group 1
VGENESESFQFTFNGFLKVAFQGSRVTSDAGLILVRELDKRLGLEAIIAAHLRDSRQGLNTQFPLPDLLRSRSTAAWRVTRTSTMPPACRPIPRFG